LSATTTKTMSLQLDFSQGTWRKQLQDYLTNTVIQKTINFDAPLQGRNLLLSKLTPGYKWTRNQTTRVKNCITTFLQLSNIHLLNFLLFVMSICPDEEQSTHLKLASALQTYRSTAMSLMARHILAKLSVAIYHMIYI
jgi:hypothetical protein